MENKVENLKDGVTYLCTFGKKAQDKYFIGYSALYREKLIYDEKAKSLILESYYHKKPFYPLGSMYVFNDFEEVVEYDENNENHYVGVIDKESLEIFKSISKNIPKFGE